MVDELPVYLPGDTIRFTIELEHDINLGDAWARFSRREEQEGVDRFPIWLDLAEIEEVQRVGNKLTSILIFDGSVSVENSLPGVYELDVMRGLPFGVQRSANRPGFELGLPERVALRIAEHPSEPDIQIRYWGLGWPENTHRYLK